MSQPTPAAATPPQGVWLPRFYLLCRVLISALALAPMVLMLLHIQDGTEHFNAGVLVMTTLMCGALAVGLYITMPYLIVIVAFLLDLCNVFN